jgi:hypothetical protein
VYERFGHNPSRGYVTYTVTSSIDLSHFFMLNKYDTLYYVLLP